MATKVTVVGLVGLLFVVPLLGLLGILMIANPAATSSTGCDTSATQTVGRLSDEAPVPDRARPWIRKAAETCPDLPEVWVAAVMAQESDFRPDVFADDRNGGTWGLFQINEYLWNQVYGPWEADRDNNGVWDIKQPLIHAEYGATYLCELLEQVRETRSEHPDWDSTTDLTELEALVVAHNAGPGRLATYPAIPQVTRTYLADVGKRLRTWSDDTTGDTTTEVAQEQQAPTAGRVVTPIPEGEWIITSPYGRRGNPFGNGRVMHHGLDFGAADGTPILAAANGTVTQAEMVPGDAGTIVIEHHLDSNVVATRYKHMWADGIHVEPGDQVVAGQHIGDVGSSGNSTGPHLHFEVRPGGADAAPVDPQPWLEQHGATDLPAPTDPETGDLCLTDAGNAPAAPTPFRGQPGGRLDDPTGTGGWITRQAKHMLGEVRHAFPDTSWSCWYQSSGGEHPIGKACDATFGNQIGQHPTDQQEDEGWRVAKWLQRYADDLRIDYLIWQGQIWSVARSDEGWREYDGGGFGDPNDVTAGHYDHLHVSVR